MKFTEIKIQLTQYPEDGYLLCNFDYNFEIDSIMDFDCDIVIEIESETDLWFPWQGIIEEHEIVKFMKAEVVPNSELYGKYMHIDLVNYNELIDNYNT